MNSLRKILSTVAILAVGFAAFQCSEDEDAPPSGPAITSEVSSLATTFGETASFNVTISAAGKLKEVKATADHGTVTVTDIIGVGQATATAKVNYTAPLPANNEETEATAKITVTVTDESSQNVTKEITVTVTQEAPLTINEITISDDAVWGPARTIYVNGDVTIAEGASLTVKEGTTVIVSENKGFVVAGNFYSLGTSTNRNTFTVAAADRTEENIFKGIWGGILGTETSEEMVVQYTTFEYAGAPAEAETPIVESGELDEGDPRFTLYFNNPDGTFVMQNSTVAYTKDDGMRINQGQLLVTHNTYILTGETGGDALNIKSGAVGDVAFNVFISSATNGVKWSNSDDREPQNNVNVYNNTAINSGWRQTKAGRGGSFNLEKGGRGQAYNNMAVNCKYGTRFPNSPDNPDLANSFTGNNLYYGNNTESVIGFYPETGSITKESDMAKNDVAGQINENDPKFAKWDVTTFVVDDAKDAANATFLPSDYDVKLVAGSPALTKGKTGFTTNFTKHTAGGVEYTVPAPANYIGAKGTN